jgi:hypothetical protein
MDYCIIGGGPCGLTIALLLSKIGKKCILIEREKSLGGCHRVVRENGYFFEHGPRIYSSAYVNSKQILELIHYNYNEHFTPYQFTISKIGQHTIFEILSLRELTIFIFEFIKLLFFINNDSSMYEFMKYHKFSEKSQDYFDRICRLTDGAGIDRYPVGKFLQLINQQLFYTISQPTEPTDKGLFRVWEKELKSITIMKNTNVNYITTYNNKIDYIVVDNQQRIYAKNYIFAIPPYNLLELLNNSRISNNLHNWVYKTMYIPYIFITFQWNSDVLKNTKRVWGFPKTHYGLAYIVLSDYFKEYKNKKTLISCCITYPQLIENDHKNIINVAFSELKESYPSLPNYDNVITKRTKDQSYIKASNTSYLNFDVFTNLYKNMYICGTYNGNCEYDFTSMESAITNGINLVNKLETKTKNIISIKKLITLRDIFWIVIFVIIIFKQLKRRR